MQIPQSFQEKIIHSFGEKGRNWLSQLPQFFDECVEKWKLTDLQTSTDLSYNYVCFGEHPEYGKVALKIGVPHLDLYSEMEAITLFEGKGLCRCYAVDESRGAMLIERILPGGDLRQIQNPQQRFEIAASLYRQIKVTPPADCELPEYDSLISNAIQRSKKISDVPSQIQVWLDEIHTLYQSLEARLESNVVLHCDLHHMNILRDGSSWRAIDPKGFVGLRAVEPARFIENELNLFPSSRPLEAINQMVTLFAQTIDSPKGDVAVCLFIDNVLSTYWSVEEHAPDAKIQDGSGQIQLALQYWQGIE
ncbi:MAG: aminoglycoside phosphotransferase family protein [Anaerolineaceae bacterium]|nr:aminoglycoside phosphotransferase family protein [Anaerolineaceae bacterium]